MCSFCENLGQETPQWTAEVGIVGYSTWTAFGPGGALGWQKAVIKIPWNCCGILAASGCRMFTRPTIQKWVVPQGILVHVAMWRQSGSQVNSYRTHGPWPSKTRQDFLHPMTWPFWREHATLSYLYKLHLSPPPLTSLNHTYHAWLRITSFHSILFNHLLSLLMSLHVTLIKDPLTSAIPSRSMKTRQERKDSVDVEGGCNTW